MSARSLTPPGGRASPLDQAAPRRLAPDRNRRPRPPLRLDRRPCRPDTAFSYTSAIEALAADLATFPERGTPRDDIAPGVRTPNFRGRTVIAYRVGEAVEVLRIFHAGQELGLVE